MSKSRKLVGNSPLMVINWNYVKRCRQYSRLKLTTENRCFSCQQIQHRISPFRITVPVFNENSLFAKKVYKWLSVTKSGLRRTSAFSPPWISKFLISTLRVLLCVTNCVQEVCSLTTKVVDENKDVRNLSDVNQGLKDKKFLLNATYVEQMPSQFNCSAITETS